MSALEEAPKEIIEFFLTHGKKFNHFLLKFSGGKGEFEKFMNSIEGKWVYEDDYDRKGVYVAYGRRVKCVE